MRVERTPYTTTFYVWNCVSAIFYSSYVTPFHSHNTLQLLFDLKKNFKCRIKDGSWGVYKTLIIKENIIHQLDTSNSVQLIIYVDAASDIAKAINLKYLQQTDFFSPDIDIRDILKPGELEHSLIEANKDLLEKLVYQLLNKLVDGKKSATTDQRIKKVIDLLATGDPGEMTISLLAEKVFLSQSRLRGVFKNATGVSLHRYIIWNKITLAISRIMNGATVAEAALSCGFSDSSHFHKMILQMFGISPSQFIKDNDKKNIDIADKSPLSLITWQYDDRFWNVERTLSIK
ncbi:MAG TPA: AraC family transcriptional regulator [Mucilaginibacter sp.]|jgi:AraC-like DNA-binding protein